MITVYLDEKSYSMIKDKRTCSPALIVEALNATTTGKFRLLKAPHKRKVPGQIVKLKLADDGEKVLWAFADAVPLTVSDFVSQKIIEHYGGDK